jgi:Nuclease-related domain
MAFYLDEFFRRVPQVKIFHNVSFVGDADVHHQIDHLVLHPLTLCIVESKSVSTEVVVNGRGEWSRRWNGRLQGMPSPVEQAKRQAAALRQLLNDRSTDLSASRKPDRFLKTPIATFVAVSDHGRWTQEGPKPAAVLPVFKADLMSETIRAEIDRHEKASKLLARPDGDYGKFRLRDTTFDRFATFLGTLTITAHSASPDRTSEQNWTSSPTESTRPQAGSRSLVSANTASAESKTFECKNCRGTDGRATPGPFGAYVTCTNCAHKNGAPKRCLSCRSETRTRIVDGSLNTICTGCGWALITSILSTA